MPTSKTTTPRKFAEGTTVTASQSFDEIKTLLKRFGATGFAQAEDERGILLIFVLAGGTPNERRIRYQMPLPLIDELPKQRGQQTPPDRRITKETERRWRALAAGIKGKLVLVEADIETIEEAFYASIVLPNGHTLYEETHPQIAHAYETGQMPQLLPGIERPMLPSGSAGSERSGGHL